MKKLFAIIFIFLTSNCFGATQLKKTVMQSGGDYTSLEACMDANEQNLVTADKYFDVEIDGEWTDDDTTAVLIHNYTTDATRYINIYTTATARHDGRTDNVSGLDNYRLNISQEGGTGFNIGDDYTTIDGLQFSKNGGSTVGTGIGGGSANAVLKNTIIHDFNGRTAALNITGTAYNIICLNGESQYNKGIRATNLYNCTVYKVGDATNQPTYGYGISIGTIGRNNIAIQCGGDTSLGFVSYVASASKDYNASDDATAAGDNSLNSGTASVPSTSDFVSVEAGSEDLRLVSSAVEINVGSDESGIFTTDIEGDTRSSFDMGADEYVSGVTPRTSNAFPLMS